MSQFDGLRRELGIEGQDERKQRLKVLHRHQKRVTKIVRQVVKDLQHQVFHDGTVREMENGGWCICRQVNELTGIPVGRPNFRKPKRGVKTVRDIAVKPVLDNEQTPTQVAYLECWRELPGNIPIGQYYSGEHPPSVTCEPTREALVDTLKQLVFQYPPGS